MAPKVFRQYWDIPDGTDCHRKAYSTTSIASVAGLTAAAYRVTLNPPGTFLEGVAKVGQYTFTAAAVGAVFGLTTCISAQVREKPDDPLNYFLGGCAGGLTLGARKTGSHCVVQAGLKLLASSSPSTSSSQSAGIIGMSHCVQRFWVPSSSACLEILSGDSTDVHACSSARRACNSSGSCPLLELGARASGSLRKGGHTHPAPRGAGALTPVQALIESLLKALGSNPRT
ncbi:LOW QUALITY PROTEIN: NDUFA11 isoform 1 [Pongo abelii]|uniref:NADH dehydrogenase [ubiquinone] 1 alpha subcomplex subunit 11 n=1 Tax=Pongo abelii TaxID=9601 RepID=A0A2J8SC99_PONAB|nr:LOW QUALITY PROTEIN: NDUFA11 isoform 1 [Pongo abelii]